MGKVMVKGVEYDLELGQVLYIPPTPQQQAAYEIRVARRRSQAMVRKDLEQGKITAERAEQLLQSIRETRIQRKWAKRQNELEQS